MPLLVVAVAWAAQGGVLRNGFVWDDANLVRDGKAVGQGFSAIPGLVMGTWGRAEGIDVGLYRPLVSASLAFQAGLHGTADPFPYHLVNLFLHGAAAMLLLAVCLRLRPDRPIVAATAALLFAAHPLHTGTVSWIVARGDLLAAVFSLAAVLAWTRPKGTDAIAVVLASLLWFLALLSKESAVFLPLVLLGIDAFARGEGVVAALRRRAPAYLALLLPLAGWYFLRQSAVGALDAAVSHAPLADRTLGERMIIAAGAFVRIVAKVALPVGLTGDASNDPLLRMKGTPLPSAYAVCAALLVGLAIAAVVRRARGRAGLVAFCVPVAFLLALPTLQLVPLGAAFEDRFAYLPSLALLPIAGLAAERLFAVRLPVLPVLVSGAVLAAFCLASWTVAATWRDEASFDRALLEDDPTHAKAVDRLGLELLRTGLDERHRAEALPQSQAGRVAALHAASAAHLDEAVRVLERGRALPSGRRNPAVLRTLADTYLAMRPPQPERAVATYEELLKTKQVRVDGKWVPWAGVKKLDTVFPGDRAVLADVFENWARALAQTEEDGRAERVAAARERAARWAPGRFEAQRLAAIAWIEAKDPARALSRLARAAELAPAGSRAEITTLLEETRESAKRQDQTREANRKKAEAAFQEGVQASRRSNAQTEALASFEEAVRLQPDFIDAHVEVARLLRWKGNIRGALDSLRTAQVLLDAEDAPDDSPQRATIAALIAKYEADRDG